MGRRRIDQSYIERLRNPSIGTEVTAQVCDASRPVQGCDDGRICKCDGAYRATPTWSDDDTPESHED